jgi:pimeloyl-ACP methyl ester carboxylesterase
VPEGHSTGSGAVTHPDARSPERSRSVDSGGLRLAVYEWGPADGTPVLLAHGSFDFARSFDVFAPLLAEAGLRVVSWDQRGHGDSEHAALYSWAADVCDARVVLDSTSPGPVHAVGHSKGGSVLMALVQALPHRFLRLVNIDGIPCESPTSSLTDEQQTQRLAAGIAGWLDGRAELRDAPRKGRSLDELARRRQAMNPRLSTEWLRYLASVGAREEEDGWRWKLDPFLRTAAFGPSRPVWELRRLRGMNLPLMALFGLVPEPMGWGASVEALGPHLPDGARVVALEDAGHFVHMEQPRRVADAVLEFLA